MSQGQGGGERRAAKPLTIGATADLLKSEFPDISISKIRYLEEEKLITPHRTAGGYRLFSRADIERLRAVLTMQRDEFLPLKVIRHELSRKGSIAARPVVNRGFKKISLKAAPGEARWYTLAEVIETTGATEALVRELEEYGIINSVPQERTRRYDQTDVEIIAAASDLAAFGVAPRNLKTLKSSVDRESALLLQILSPQLRSTNLQARKEGIATLENLATVSSYLKHLLLIKDLKSFITR